MAFPTTPTNGQQSVVNGITYQYASATNSWTRVAGVANTLSASGNITAGNLITGGLITAAGNITGGNIFTLGEVSATGNITGNNISGNGYNLTGINTFKTVEVTGQTSIVAANIDATLTLAAGNNISITTGGNTVTIAYSASGGGSIFATGGDMGLIANPVTSSEDLGNVTDVASTSYDLGGLFITTTTNQLDVTGFSGNVNAANVNLTGLISAAGNITGNYFFGNGSQLTGVTSSAAFPLANGTSNINGTTNGNITIGIGGTSNVVVYATTGEYITGLVSATGNVTGNYFIGNGSALTGINSTPPALNIILQQNFGGF